MRVPYLVFAALMPAVVLAAPAGKLQTEIAGFTRGAPVPKWATLLTDIPRTERTDPVVIRLNEIQAWVGGVPATTVNRAIQVNDSSELGVIGQFSINYFAQYQKLALHRVVILRGDQRLDRTASVNIRPLQRETNIESGLLGGATTVQLLLDDVRIGDTLWISYTVEGENPVFGKHWSAEFHWDSSSPIELRRVTVLHPRNRPVIWRQLGDFLTAPITPQIDQLGDMERLRFEARSLEAVEGEPSVPPEYLPVRMLQFTEYQDWHGVASWADSLFPKLEASPALKTLARQFAGEADAEARAGAALHWVQNEIRYFSVSIGENSHRPQQPDVVLKRRYGDCKDKSYLLVSLLRELGVKAQLVLLSADAPAIAAKLLPTPTWFNHVIVQISIDGRDYYVDPTRVNQPEPLATMPVAFPGAKVLRVDPAALDLSTIPERSDTQPAYEHIEDIVAADFSGAATLVTRDVYRSTYADAMRVYFTRMSATEQKKAVLANYEKLYPGVGLEGAPTYQDVVAENRVEITSHYKLPKAVTLKNQQYQIAFASKIVEGSLGIPSKLVRNFPFQLAAGLYSGRYRLHIHWPAQVRRNDPASVKMLDNPYFQIREEYALRGSEVDYMVDYRLKQRSLPASELPALQEQAKLLEEYIEGTLRVDQAAAVPPELQAYSMRDLESLRDTYDVAQRLTQLAGKKDQDIGMPEACMYLDSQYELSDFIGIEGMQMAQRMEKLLAAAKPQAGLGACKAKLAFARMQYQAGVDALAADPLKDDASPLMRELAWAQFRIGDKDAALATMARYRSAREQAAGGMAGAADVASQIALLQRAGQPLPAAVQQFARDVPDGPWPRPVLAMQIGLLSPEKLLQQAEALNEDSKALALIDAWFYIGQARLAAQDLDGAERAFRWLSGNGLRNHSLSSQARAERLALGARDQYADAGMKAVLRKDLAAAIAAWQKGAAAGSAASRHSLGMAALYGQGLPESPEQALQWFQLAADQGYRESQAMLGILYIYGTGTAKDVDKGLDWLRKGAQQAEPNAQYELGHRYRWGSDVKQDFALARRLLQQAADQDKAGAMADLGGMYRHGEGMPKDAAQALFWYRRGAIYNNANAMYGLAGVFGEGDGVARDYARAAALYRAAAELKHAGAAVELGLLYEKGNGVPQSDSDAVEWYRKAADLGDRYGMGNLANMYESGRGIARDPVLATNYRRKAIELGNASAMVNLGYNYEKGIGVPQDNAQARYWYEKAAAQHNSAAEFNLARIYDEGVGVEVDAVLGLQWYKRAAEDGDLDAQYRWAQALFYGNGAAVNKAEAVVWYEKSAAQGLLKAQEALGQIYLSGMGVPADLPKGIALLRQAAAQKSLTAYVGLGTAYEKGLGVEKDMAQAIAWFEKAAMPGQTAVQVRLGTLYLADGKNESRGRRMLQDADDQDSAADFAVLAAAYISVDNKGKAEWAYLRGLELAERTPDENAANLRNYLAQVVSFYKSIYQYEKAEPYLKRSLQLAEKALGARAPALADELETMGDLYQFIGHYAEAEAVYQRALSILEETHGVHSTEVAAMLDSLGGLYLAADQFEQAVSYGRRALALNEELNDPALPATLRHLAASMMEKGDFAEAEKLVRRALALQEKQGGPDSPALLGGLDILAAIYYVQEAYDQASTVMERALKIRTASATTTPYSMAVHHTNLAAVRIGQKRYAEAEVLLKESQATKERLLAPNHAELSYGVLGFGVLYKSQQQYAKAQPLLERALALREGAPGYNSVSMIAEVLQELGEVYGAQAMYQQAEAVLLRAQSLRSRVLNEQHPALQKTRRSLAELKRKSGNA